MAGQWKDFKIEHLRGDEIPSTDVHAEKNYKHPTKKQFLRWTVNVKNANLAMSAGWLMPMAATLPFADGAFSNLGNRDVADDFDSFEFGYMVIDLVIDHGGLHSLPHPVDWFADHHIVANFKYIVNSIAMFNAQMSIRCIDMFPQIYGRVEAVNHPLVGLQNWIEMYRTFMHEAVVHDSDAAWAGVTKHVATSFKPSAESIKIWIGTMNEKVRACISAEVNPVIIYTVILGTVLGKFRKFKDLTINSQRWINRGIDYD